MGNIGRPSAGCLLCRKRKVKCDRSEPSCENCQRIRKSCPGYRPESELLFRNQTSHTVARSHRKYEKASPLVTRSSSLTPPSLPTNQNDDEVGSGVSADSPKVTLALRLREGASASSSSLAPIIPYFVSSALPLDDEAICLFLADYVQVPQNGWLHGHLEFLPSMLQNAKPTSCLSQSVHAVAHQYIYNLRGQRQIRLRAQDYYSQSLETIHKALEDPHERLEDATLLSVWLVGLYELFNGVIKGIMEESKGWISHVRGTALLLHLRGQQQFNTLRGRTIFRLAHGLTSIYALMTGSSPLVNFEIDSLYSPQWDWKPPKPQIRSSLFSRAICLLCSDIKALVLKPIYTNKDIEELRRLKDETFRVEAGMQDWTGDRAEWQPRQKDISLDSIETRNFAHSDLVEYHESSFPLTHWTLYRASRIALHEALLGADRKVHVHLNDSLTPEPSHSTIEPATKTSSLLTPDERHHCQNTLSNMSSQLLGTMPYILGDIDSHGVVYNPLVHGPRACAGKAHQGIPIIWPLRMIKRSLYTDERQKRLATEALRKIGWGMGIRQALEVANM